MWSRLVVPGFSIPLEASPELSSQPNTNWASGTGNPILGYCLEHPEPQLNIAPFVQNGSVVLSWLHDATGMQLQRTPSLTVPDWQFVAGSEATNQVTLPIGSGSEFFRLVEP